MSGEQWCTATLQRLFDESLAGLEDGTKKLFCEEKREVAFKVAILPAVMAQKASNLTLGARLT